MNNSTIQQPLSDDELDRLGEFLDEIGVPAMNMESLDGYFAALICGPDMVLPSEYLPGIWGEDFCFDSNNQATDILGLLMRHWGTISSELFRTLKEPYVYMPVLLEDDEGIAQGNDWARGFMRGVQARPASWRELIVSDEHGGPLLPIMLLAHPIHGIAAIRQEHWYKPLESHRDRAVTPPSMPGQNLPCPPPTTTRFCHSHCQVFTRRRSQPLSTVA